MAQCLTHNKPTRYYHLVGNFLHTHKFQHTMTHADEIRIIQNMEMLAIAKFLKMDIPSLFSDNILNEIREYQKVCAERAKFATKWLNA